MKQAKHNGMGQRIYLNNLTLVYLHSSLLRMLNSPISIGYSVFIIVNIDFISSATYL